MQPPNTTLRQVEKEDLKKVKVTRAVGGALLEAEVSPCAWMYPNYPFQITVKMFIDCDGNRLSLGNVIHCDRSLVFKDATQADMERLLNQVGVVPCKRCGKPAFDPESVSTNRESLCEQCFVSDLTKNYEAATAAENKRIAKKDAAMREKGYKFRVDAWIHPSDGEDELASIYLVEATPALIKNVLKKAGSEVFDDYTIVTL